jgi:hypothetical protein
MSANNKNTLHLSIYGYGMISFATAMAILLSHGYFMAADNDLLLSWGMAIFGGASGALALAMVRTYFPKLQNLPALLAATALNIFLFSSYFTSYFGYSRIYVMQTNPNMISPDAMNDFWPLLMYSWANTCMAAFIASAAYFIIQNTVNSFVRVMTPKNQ